MSERAATGVVAVALCAALGLLAIRVVSRDAPTHDGAISFIAATGHQLEYAGAARELGGRWVPASRWQRLASDDGSATLGSIAAGLAETDVHPPLYFWSLRAVIDVAGPSLTAALLVNLAMVIATALLIAMAVGRLGGSRFAQLAAAVVWLASGAAVDVVGEARPYALLALSAAALLVLALAYVERPRPGVGAALAAVCAAGFATHLHFAIAAGAAAGAAAFVLAVEGRWRAVAGLAAALVAAAAIAALIAPDIGALVARAREQSAGSVDLGYRAPRTGASIAALLVPSRWAVSLGWPALVASAALLGAAIIAVARRPRAWASRGRLPTLAAAVALVALVALYLAGASPRHAMRAKYLALACPFAAVAAGLLVSRVRAANRRAAAAVLAAAVVLLAIPRGAADLGRPSADLDATPIVIDSAGRGHVVRALWRAAPETPVLAVTSAVPPLDAPALQLVRARPDPSVLDALERQGYRVVSERRTAVGPVVHLAR